MTPSIKNSQGFKFDNARYLSIISEEKNPDVKDKLTETYKEFISIVDTIDRTVDGMGELGAVNYDYQVEQRQRLEKVRLRFEEVIKEALRTRQQK
jgi:hypothetical protein